MKKFVAVAALALALVGCAGQAPEEKPSSTPEKSSPPESKNLQACKDFEAVSGALASLITDPTSDAERLDGIRGEFDSVALEADGIIQDRMLAVIETLPEHPITWLADPADDYFTALEDVGRACLSETGDEFQVSTWS